MSKLWQKNWNLNKDIEEFETKGDLEFDIQLTKYDCLASLAHAEMLQKIGILTQEEFNAAKKGLKEIIEFDKEGKFNLELGDEDIHTKIENYLTENYGEVGKKIHTGRSRNDQVLTALRLYTKAELSRVWQETILLSQSFLDFAKKYEKVLMPGFTHFQKAMPTTVGMWGASFAEGLLDGVSLIKASYQLNDRSPLGTAAGFGVPLNLDRDLTAKLMGFSKLQINPIYAQHSRAKTSSITLSALLAILSDINRFASDVLLFTTAGFDYFKVADELCSGSSIMPQKKNVDVAELLRSKLHLVLGNFTALVSLSSNLISGYNRDIQDGKKLLMESLQTTIDSLKAANILINNIEPKKENLKAALTPEIFATHKAYELVKKGTSFRDAYQEVGKNLSSLEGIDLDKVINDSTHLGGLGNLGLDRLADHLSYEKKLFENKVADE